MELCTLYNRLGRLITTRENIESDIEFIQSESNDHADHKVDILLSLQMQLDRTHQQIQKIVEEINSREDMLTSRI